VLYTLLDTWERTLSTLAVFGLAEEHRSIWEEATTRLDLTADIAPPRLDELETYLDTLEAFLEEWSARYGA